MTSSKLVDAQVQPAGGGKDILPASIPGLLHRFQLLDAVVDDAQSSGDLGEGMVGVSPWLVNPKRGICTQGTGDKERRTGGTGNGNLAVQALASVGSVNAFAGVGGQLGLNALQLLQLHQRGLVFSRHLGLLMEQGCHRGLNLGILLHNVLGDAEPLGGIGHGLSLLGIGFAGLQHRCGLLRFGRHSGLSGFPQPGCRHRASHFLVVEVGQLLLLDHGVFGQHTGRCFQVFGTNSARDLGVVIPGPFSSFPLLAQRFLQQVFSQGSGLLNLGEDIG
jgi:hypothetical protein